MIFSLIVATKGHRIDLIRGFLGSLVNSSEQSFQVIIACQDEYGYLDSILQEFKCLDLQICYTHSGLSRARNVGLTYATGEIIGFPDDDCEYTEHTLGQVRAFFSNNPDYGLLSVSCWNLEQAKKLSFVSLTRDTELLLSNTFQGVSSISIFHRAVSNHRFDERFGLGAQYNSSEEFDYVVELLLKGVRGKFIADIRVLHPDNNVIDFKVLKAKVKRNSLGHGAYLKKHRSNLGLKATLENLWVKPLLGALFYFCTFRFKRAILSYFSLTNRVKSYFRFS
ncbi:glycosyltransferase family 2 protein [Roseivirga sp. UBA838]|uniref:glycosyltransferase family 2 protein n=1 Tax=Roseivirga sp. UBA838 TaxID=1947393 RepID=UPI0025806DFE|nr:glycosyltransferase family 2 protein [Roseivirga sp. UBA838]|tara:strand:+ start:61605 stop:62444 length:840 start_codon:yes stop_codon:yes gene_type:complete